MGMVMIANEEIDDKWTVGMVDDDKKMEITMIAIKEIDDKLKSTWLITNGNDNDR